MAKPIDRFRLHEALETHGDIVLYRADEELPGGATRRVQLKVFPHLSPKDKTIETRFHSQVRVMAQLTSKAYVVPLLSAGVTENQPWIAMELLANTFAGLRGERPGDPAVIEKMLRHVALALAAMHGATPPLLHNAVVPENIHVDALGNFRLGGFDSSGPAASDIAYTAATIQYAPPEMLSQELGRAVPASDLYALGHVAYEYALGSRLYRPQFPAVFDPKDPKHEVSSAKWMAWHYSMGAKIPPVAELIKEFPPGLSEVISHLTAKPLSDRTASAGALLAELDRAAGARAAAVPTAIPVGGGVAPVAPIRSAVPVRSFGRPATAAAAPATPAGAPASADPNATRYYCRLRGRMTGPFDLATLQRHVRQGAVSRFHEVSTDRQNWRPVTSVEGLFGGTAAAPAAET